MTVYAGLDLGGTTSLAFLNKRTPTVFQVDISRNKRVDELTDVRERLHSLRTWLCTVCERYTAIDMLLIEEPPMVRNTKVYGLLSAYYGVALEAVTNCKHIRQVASLKTAAWRKLIGAAVAFKRGEFEQRDREKVTKQAVIIRVEKLTDKSYDLAQHDMADAVGLACAAKALAQANED